MKEADAEEFKVAGNHEKPKGKGTEKPDRSVTNTEKSLSICFNFLT
jgi:hypothetical protein